MKRKKRYREETYRSSGRKKKRSRFGDVLSIILMIAALCVFIGAAVVLYGYYREYQKVDETYDGLLEYAGESETEDEITQLEDEYEQTQAISGREVKDVWWNGELLTLPVLNNPIDFEGLKEINSDLAAWLKIRALDLSYPVVQAEDNDYYLHTSFENEYLFSGCLFVNYENRSDFSDKNTIIYGHNMRNGSMFGTLKTIQEEDVYKKSKYFWIYTEDIIFMYRIISARVVEDAGLTYQIVFPGDDFQNFIDAAMENSVVDNSGVQVSTDDRIVTLSTCTGDSSTRFVVQGKLAQMYASK